MDKLNKAIHVLLSEEEPLFSNPVSFDDDAGPESLARQAQSWLAKLGPGDMKNENES